MPSILEGINKRAKAIERMAFAYREDGRFALKSIRHSSVILDESKFIFPRDPHLPAGHPFNDADWGQLHIEFECVISNLKQEVCP